MQILKNFITVLLFLILSITAFQTETFAKSNLYVESGAEYRRQGSEAQEKGNLDEALTLYTKALSLELDDSAAIYNDMAIIYERLGLTDRAESYYLQAIEEDKNYLPSYMNLAYLYKGRGERRKAVEYFHKRVNLSDGEDFWTQRANQELHELDPSYRHAILLRDAEQLDQELREHARQELTQKVAKSGEYYKNGQRLVKKQEYDKAIAHYNQALLLTPNNPKILKARENAILHRQVDEVKRRSEYAVKFLNAGDTLAAKEEYRRILTIIPNDPVRTQTFSR